MQRTARVYVLVGAFCLLFHFIYTSCSYGASSVVMAGMWLVPMVGGAAPAWVLAVKNRGQSVTRVSFNLWNSGIATLTAGFLVRGIINISGRFTQYDQLYWALAACLLVAAVLAGVWARLCRW